MYQATQTAWPKDAIATILQNKMFFQAFQNPLKQFSTPQTQLIFLPKDNQES